MENPSPLNVIVIGASAGGFASVSKLLSSIDAHLDAAIFVVVHLSRDSNAENICRMLQKHTSMNCKVAVDGETIMPRHIYIPSADHHMLIDVDKIVVQKGAYENHHRPAIDVLFRSAAANYGACVIGVILTGMLDDGTSGMYAIKRSGGICIVQHPQDAEFSNMPLSVINNMQVDYKLPVTDIGPLLNHLLMNRQCAKGDIPQDVMFEAKITRRMSSDPEDLKKLGPPTDLSCPDCGGNLYKIQEDVIPRFRCFTGHSFTAACLEDLQLTSLEESIWTAIRLMEQRRNLLYSIHDSSGGKVERADELTIHVERLKALLQILGKDGE